MVLSKKVAVIGAGLSGLVAIKELVAEGHDVVCLEKSAGIGGVFSGENTYDSLMLTATNYFMAYSDFMPLSEKIKFWTCDEYRNYLKSYANHFNLYEKIRFNIHVKNVERKNTGDWILRCSSSTGEDSEYVVENLVVCAGQFQKSFIPNISGMETFPGEIIHSSAYKNRDTVKNLHGKRVLCLGMGESAADVISEVAEVADKSVLALRRYHSFAPRNIDSEREWGCVAIDLRQVRYWHSLPSNEKAHEVKQFMRNILKQDNPPPVAKELAEHMLMADDEPGSVVTKSERIFGAVVNDGLDIDVGGIESINGKTVTFKSGRKEDFDGIVCCTGFEFTLPFLPEKYQLKNIREAYLQVFHPQLRESLTFVGFVRPTQGGIPLMAELQSRYLAKVLSGEKSLPADIIALAKKDEKRWRDEFYVTPNVHGLVNGLRYNEMMADLIGCRLPKPNIFREPKKFYAYWFAHIWPCQYRVVGPGATPAARVWEIAPTEWHLKKKIILTFKMLYLNVLSVLPIPKGNKWRPLIRKSV